MIRAFLTSLLLFSGILPAESPALAPTTGACEGSTLLLDGVEDATLRAALAAFDLAEGEPKDFEWTLRKVSGRRVQIFELTFPSPRPSRHEENNTVWCRYYRPRGLEEGERAPAAMVLHKMGGGDELEAMLAGYLASSGVHALEVEFPYYGARQPAGEDPRQNMLREDVTSWIEPMQQCVADIRRAADWLLARDDVDPERIGVVGISLGGIIGALTAGVDQRMKRNALVIAGGDLAKIVMTPSRETREIRDAIRRKEIPLEDLPEILAPIEPLRYAHRMDSAGTLLVNARDDEVIVREATEALVARMDEPRVEWFPGGHYGIAMHLPNVLALVKDHYLAPAEGESPADEPTPAEEDEPAPAEEDEFF